MDLLFRRSQSHSSWGRPRFDLHAKLDLDAEELELIRKYSFAETVLIHVPQPDLMRHSILLGLVSTFVLTPIIAFNFWRDIGMGWVGVICVAAVIGFLIGFFYYHQKRETIYVKDLMHGRYFHCPSICELVRKESYLMNITAYLRQVMESAKNWGGTDRKEIHPLSPEEAKAAIHSGPLF